MIDYEYPTEKELAVLSGWDWHDIAGLLDEIRRLWWMPDWGFVEPYRSKGILGKSAVKFQLHTGGWSGNEDIIDALMENMFFWTFYWQKSEYGGHYWFEVPQYLSKGIKTSPIHSRQR